MTVKELRKERGWSQQQLADMAGVTRRTVQRVEQGNRASVETLKALASLLEVDFRSLQAEPGELENDAVETARSAREEKEALAYGRRMKDFLQVACCYLFLAIVYLVLFQASVVMMLIFAMLGLCVVIQGLIAFDVIKFMNPSFEREVAERKLGRKL